MTGDPTTLGYEAEPGDVAAEVAGILGGWGDDPLPRYHAATAAQVHHQAVVNALADERGRIAARWNVPDADGRKLSYQEIADRLGISRAKAQQLVERGRGLL